MRRNNKGFRLWKDGELKAYLAEQRALQKMKEAQKQMYEDGKAHAEWVKYIQSIYMDTITKHAAYVTMKQGAFSPALPVEEQYQEHKRIMQVPLILNGD
ncbi:hypothetical protein UJ50_001705 [Salmonella enterica subsp. enterica]|nr:hypothetical protein [Salmonella enterica subsp. enterica]